MNANKKKVTILVAILVLGGVLVWTANRKSPEEIERSERFARIRAERDAAAKSGKSPAAGKEAAAEDTGVFKTADVDIDALSQSIQEVEFEYNIERLSRDPMSPLIGLKTAESTSESSQPQIGLDQRLIQTARLKSVSGIVWDDLSPFAVIDNEVVTTGYAYPEGIIVDEIHPDHVVFRVNDARVEVELKEQ